MSTLSDEELIERIAARVLQMLVEQGFMRAPRPVPKPTKYEADEKTYATIDALETRLGRKRRR
jgi:translation elongation factor EF-Tu-like GTPase